jgi:hypothetical protein
MAQNHQWCNSKCSRRFRIHWNQLQKHHTKIVRAQRWRNRLRHKSATTCQNISGRFEDSISSQFLVNPELRHSSYQSSLIGITSDSSVYDICIGICSQIWGRWGDELEIYRIPLFWSSQNQISHAFWCTFHRGRASSGQYFSVSEFNHYSESVSSHRIKNQKR